MRSLSMATSLSSPAEHASPARALSYSHAEALFKDASSGATLHQLHYSALTHDAEVRRL